MAEALTRERLEKAFDKAISKMPQNVIKNNMDLIEKCLQAGLTFKRIAEIFDEDLEIKIKPSEIKNAYNMAKSEGKKQGDLLDNKAENPVQKQTVEAEKH